MIKPPKRIFGELMTPNSDIPSYFVVYYMQRGNVVVEETFPVTKRKAAMKYCKERNRSRKRWMQFLKKKDK